MTDLLVPAALLLVMLLAAFLAYRMTGLGRGMKAYKEAQELLVKREVSAQERARLEILRRRARSQWGPSMDPGLPPMERLSRGR